MKKIEAIIKPFKLDDAKEALGQAGVQGMSVSEVKLGDEGTYRALSRRRVRRGLPAQDQDRSRGPGHASREVTLALCQAASTGKIGDGKIFVLPVDDAIRIRTGETGDSALSGASDGALAFQASAPSITSWLPTRPASS